MTEIQLIVAVAAGAAIVWVMTANWRDRRRAAKARPPGSSSASVIEEPIYSGPSAERAKAYCPDPLSDAIARLRFVTPVALEKILPQMRGWHRVGSKPLSFGWSTDGADFQSEPQGGEVQALEIGVLMATRSGPLHAVEYTEWREALERIATVCGAQLDIPPMSDVLTQARALDETCAGIDAQLSIGVTTPQVLSASAIQSAALSLGLDSRGELRFVPASEEREQSFTVFAGDSGNSLTLLLDVPRAANPLAAFAQMRECAVALAETLSGEITDDSGRALDYRALEMIEKQIAEKAERLVSAGITPGSALALRLFM